MKTKTKFLFSWIMSAICVASVALAGVQLFTKDNADATKSVYEPNFTLFAYADTTQTDTISSAWLFSEGNDYMLFATAFKVGEGKTYSEIGYTVTVDGTSTDYPSADGGKAYYTGIRVTTADGIVEQTTQDIFGEIDATGMIVDEFEYDPSKAYVVTPYMQVEGGEKEMGKAITVDAYASLETSYVARFYPSTILDKPQISSYGDATSTISTEHTVLSGNKVTQFTVAAGTAANSGVKMGMTATTYAGLAEAGYPAVFPGVANKAIEITLHVINTGSEDISFRYAVVVTTTEVGGYVDVTVPAGETKVVTFDYKPSSTTRANNHMLIMTEAVENGASFAIWGEIEADETLDVSAVSIHQAATKTEFKVGETFSSAGLVLDPTCVKGGRWLIADNLVTNFDGKVFTAEDVGTHTVIVGFAGCFTTYEITVTE